MTMTDKAKGLANEAICNVERGASKPVGSNWLEAEGVAQDAKGSMQKAPGDARVFKKGD